VLSGASAVVKGLGSNVSRKIFMNRGVKHGCPCSPIFLLLDCLGLLMLYLLLMSNW
jgi:hypothetical protein